MRKYSILTGLITPFVMAWLALRILRGKEDLPRIRERLGFASAPRPKGLLLWLHAASVGEANSVLFLIHKIRERYPRVSILITTGTITSARLMASRLPGSVIHQYVPLDMPKPTRRFIRYWKPELAFWVESELWPNLIMAADYYQCFMGIINGRMSERSFKRWLKHKTIISKLIGRFNIIFTQSETDAERFITLGGQTVICTGNMKYDAMLLPCDEAELVRIKNIVTGRPTWLAASTHPGEEAMIASVHKTLAATYPNLLTIIVPRHPKRGSAIAQELRPYRVALRSKQQPITSDTQIYIADTLGELGLFYRLCDIVFMGGSLVEHGGQNPLEAARLACGILTGPHTHNFSDIYQEMEKLRIVRRVGDADALAAQVAQLLDEPETLDGMQTAARQWITQQGGATQRLLDIMTPLFETKP